MDEVVCKSCGLRCAGDEGWGPCCSCEKKEWIYKSQYLILREQRRKEKEEK